MGDERRCTGLRRFVLGPLGRGPRKHTKNAKKTHKKRQDIQNHKTTQPSLCVLDAVDRVQNAPFIRQIMAKIVYALFRFVAQAKSWPKLRSTFFRFGDTGMRRRRVGDVSGMCRGRVGNVGWTCSHCYCSKPCYNRRKHACNWHKIHNMFTHRPPHIYDGLKYYHG